MSTDTLPAVANGRSPAYQIDHEAVLRALNLNPRDAKAQALLLICDRYGLDPVLKHMVLIQGTPYVTRDGLLHVAHRSEQLDGIEIIEQGETPTHHVAKVSVFRKDMSHPFTYVGRYPKNGSNKAYGPEMAVKCGEVMALRRAFDVGLCATEELWDRDEVGAVEVTAAPRPDNASGYAKGQYASPEQSAEFGKRLDAFIERKNAEWLDRWANPQGELPEWIKDLLNRWQCDNHLLKWAVETGRLTGVDMPTENKARQVGRYTAIVFHRSPAEAKAVKRELERYATECAARQTEDILRKHPELATDEGDADFSDEEEDAGEREPGADG